eukprot:TRINITY_DN65940_c9_g1_i1.p1 TRINITY_DN65940_c9_g1~~TRINITY_DN65940_c9_g1_i1.p1  ORF type:complete len:546 (+),score=296.98 TRINITY_DN65940_c9_g1_i1:241-1878(+)
MSSKKKRTRSRSSDSLAEQGAARAKARKNSRSTRTHTGKGGEEEEEDFAGERMVWHKELQSPSGMTRGYVAQFAWEHYPFAKVNPGMAVAVTDLVPSIPTLFRTTLNVLQHVEHRYRGLHTLDRADRRIVRAGASRDPKIALHDLQGKPYTVTACRKEHVKFLYLPEDAGLLPSLGLCPHLICVHMYTPDMRRTISGFPVDKNLKCTCKQLREQWAADEPEQKLIADAAVERDNNGEEYIMVFPTRAGVAAANRTTGAKRAKAAGAAAAGAGAGAAAGAGDKDAAGNAANDGGNADDDDDKSAADAADAADDDSKARGKSKGKARAKRGGSKKGSDNDDDDGGDGANDGDDKEAANGDAADADVNGNGDAADEDEDGDDHEAEDDGSSSSSSSSGATGGRNNKRNGTTSSSGRKRKARSSGSRRKPQELAQQAMDEDGDLEDEDEDVESDEDGDQVKEPTAADHWRDLDAFTKQVKRGVEKYWRNKVRDVESEVNDVREQLQEANNEARQWQQRYKLEHDRNVLLWERMNALKKTIEKISQNANE